MRPHLHHVGVVVDDLEAAVRFFLAVGMRLEGRATVQDDWVDRVIGLEGASSDVAMLETPDGHGRVELTRFRSPTALEGDSGAPANALGIRHIAIEVDGLDSVLGNLRGLGFGPVGEVERFEDVYRICYVRGPEGILIELAERLG